MKFVNREKELKLLALKVYNHKILKYHGKTKELGKLNLPKIL
jgi:hypothetical protein